MALLAGVVLAGAAVAQADAGAGTVPGDPGSGAAAARLEHLDRGLVAVSSGEGVFLSWRLLGSEATGHTDTGMDGPDFHVYRDGRRIATVTDSTNYLDRSGASGAEYRAVPVVDGKEAGRSGSVSPTSEDHLTMSLKKPADGVTPAGESYTYRANDMSVGDVDGDGQYEYLVKWDPSNSKDVSKKGLHRQRLHRHLPARRHPAPPRRSRCQHPRGRALHPVPGLRLRRRRPLGDDVHDGARHQGHPLRRGRRRRLRAVHHHAEGGRTGRPVPPGRLPAERRGLPGPSRRDVQGLAQAPEVVAGNWPATLEAAFGIEKRYDYPLSRQDAEKLADYFIDVYAPSRSDKNKLRDFEGFVLDGPEYLTVFNGASGAELETVRYEPGRHDDGLMWGDYAMPRIEPGNRVDRFLGGVAYLDGVRPSAVFARGYYTRTMLVAYRWDGEHPLISHNDDSAQGRGRSADRPLRRHRARLPPD